MSDIEYDTFGRDGEDTSERRCPFCDFVADTTAAEVAHMETRHREIVAERLRDAGFDAPTFHPPAFGADRIAELQAEVERLRAYIGEAGPDTVRFIAESVTEVERLRAALRPALSVIQNVQHGNRYRADDLTLAEVADVLDDLLNAS